MLARSDCLRGVRVLSLKVDAGQGMAELDLAPDLRIFRAEFRIMRPYSVQAMVRGEWRDTSSNSAGRGRHGNTWLFRHHRRRCAMPA
jgi:hypothetical protein